MRTVRLSNIELLRILLMLMVVILHFVGHNALSSQSLVEQGNNNWWSANILESFCVCAVNTFVLISGYFGIKASLRKIILFLLPIMFYEFIISLIYYGVYHQLSFTPFNYWFVPPFFLLMLFSPIINAGLKQMNRKMCAFTILLLCLFLILPFKTILSLNSGKNFEIFLTLYIIGYFLKNHYTIKKSSNYYFASYAICSTLILLETYLFAVFGYYKGSGTVSYNYDNPLLIIQTVCLLLAFTSITPPIMSTRINWVASSAFFVYIISENTNIYLKPYGLYDLLNVNSWINSPWYFLSILGSSIIVFILCIIIDKIRILTFHALENYIGDKLDNIENIIKNKI